eukprot:COSAG02_NODE_43669_length_372_cov_7.875458_1_plen_38_part_10
MRTGLSIAAAQLVLLQGRESAAQKTLVRLGYFSESMPF